MFSFSEKFFFPRFLWKKNYFIFQDFFIFTKVFFSKDFYEKKTILFFKIFSFSEKFFFEIQNSKNPKSQKKKTLEKDTVVVLRRVVNEPVITRLTNNGFWRNDGTTILNHNVPRKRINRFSPILLH